MSRLFSADGGPNAAVADFLFLLLLKLRDAAGDGGDPAAAAEELLARKEVRQGMRLGAWAHTRVDAHRMR
jgi:hypothetical protein